jgi:hypothetical protein
MKAGKKTRACLDGHHIFPPILDPPPVATGGQNWAKQQNGPTIKSTKLPNFGHWRPKLGKTWKWPDDQIDQTAQFWSLAAKIGQNLEMARRSNRPNYPILVTGDQNWAKMRRFLVHRSYCVIFEQLSNHLARISS